MPAAPDVVGLVVPDRSRVIRMARPGMNFQFAVVLGNGIVVLNHRRQRRAGEHPVQQAGENLGPVALLPGSGALVPTRGPAGHLG